MSISCVEKDPDEKHNLINDPDYFGKIIELRASLYEHLANSDGDHNAPFTAWLAEGMNLRDKDGSKAAPFPSHWKVEPNREDIYMKTFRDTPLKQKRKMKGKLYFPIWKNCQQRSKCRE